LEKKIKEALEIAPFLKLMNAYPIFIKLGMYIMTSEPTTAVYSINLSHQSVCMRISPTIVVRQRLGKKVPRQQIHATMEFLDVMFSMRSVSSQMKAGDEFFPEFLVDVFRVVLTGNRLFPSAGYTVTRCGFCEVGTKTLNITSGPKGLTKDQNLYRTRA
jgi:hypothetical protein